MKVWITRRPLTEGILEVEVDQYYARGEGREWHRTRDSAVDRCERVRKRRIALLKAQMQTLEDTRFV